MIHARWTNLDKRRVAVESDRVRFPERCLICRNTRFEIRKLSFVRVLLDQHSVLEVRVPLCDDHYRMHRLRSWFAIIASAISFAAGALLLYVAAQYRFGPTASAFGFTGVSLMIVSILTFSFVRSRILPIRVVQKYSRQVDKLVWIFFFGDDESARSFYDANAPGET